jgi:hypothetical protein
VPPSASRNHNAALSIICREIGNRKIKASFVARDARIYLFTLLTDDAAPNVPSNFASRSRARRFSIPFSNRLLRRHTRSFTSPLAL